MFENTKTQDNTKIVQNLKLFDLPLSLVFNDKKYTYAEYNSVANSITIENITDFVDKRGTLNLGSTVLADIHLLKNDSKYIVHTGSVFSRPDIHFLTNAHVTVSAEFKSIPLPVEDVLDLQPGSLIKSTQSIEDDDLLEMRVEDKIFAYANAATINDNYACVFSKILFDKKSINKLSRNEKPSVQLRPVFAKQTRTMYEVLSFEVDSVIEFDKTISNPIEIVSLGNTILAHVIVVNRKICFRVQQIKNSQNSNNQLVVSETPEKSDIELNFDFNKVAVIIKKYIDQLLNSQQAQPIPQSNLKNYKDLNTLLKSINTEDIAYLIKNEHPQLISYILSLLSTEKSRLVLELIDPSIQYDIIERLVLQKPVDAVIKKHVFEKLLKKMQNTYISNTYKASGINDAVSLLKNVDKMVEKQIIENIEVNNPDLAVEIQDQLFKFEDIIKLNDEATIYLLYELDIQDLASALIGSDKSIKNHFINLLSEKEKAKLFEAITQNSAISNDEVIKAQKQMINMLRILEQQGKIELPRS